MYSTWITCYICKDVTPYYIGLVSAVFYIGHKSARRVLTNNSWELLIYKESYNLQDCNIVKNITTFIKNIHKNSLYDYSIDDSEH